MKSEKIIKSNQEQAIAAWINYLNQLRLTNLVESLNTHEKNFMSAINTIDAAFDSIKESIIDKNLGSYKGMHGFIAEVAECGISNARQQIKGNQGNYSWVNDNGPVDLLRNGVAIQQKFVESRNYLSLGAISNHLSKYPDYIEKGWFISDTERSL